MRNPFTWQEVEHWTGADLMETLQLLTEQSEADDFISAYAEACADDEDHAEHNVRYMLDVLARNGEKDEAERLAELFGVELPQASEILSPRQWFTNSSLGVKVES